MSTQTTEAPGKNTIEKASVDLASTKYQMVLAALLIVFSCCCAYGSTLKIGFLLDDYLHLDYAARAVAGQWGPLLNNFTSNWGGSDIMKSYRPVISLSIFIDYLLYHTHAFGYHLTNLIVFCSCSLMVALVTLELTGRTGGRSRGLAALWAGLLFSVYPLHAESVAWVIGRVDTFATVFYLASIFCFLRLELLKEGSFLLRSLLFFLLALTSKEVAVSLPVAVTLLACLPPGRLQAAPGARTISGEIKLGEIIERLKHAFFASLPYWLTLLAYVVFRQALLGTTVGGYGEAGIGDLFQSLKIFADRDSLTKIFIPVSEEYVPVRAMALSCIAPVAAIGVLFLLRQLGQYARGYQKLAPYILPVTTILWLVIALVPAFQIWHIYPNLVGSRLFFLSSTGLCIALALMALPATEPLGRKGFTAWSTAGVAAMAILYLVWFNALQVNLRAWKEASDLVAKFEMQVKAAAQNNTVAIFNLPQDYKGAGMIGRRLYLDICNRPPFTGADLSGRLQILEPKITGSREYTWPYQLAEMARLNGPGHVYVWSNSSGRLERADSLLSPKPARAVTAANSLVEALAAAQGQTNGAWEIKNRNALMIGREKLDGTSPQILYRISRSTLSAEQAGAKELDTAVALTVDAGVPSNWMLSLAGEDVEGLTGKCKIIWTNQAGVKLGEANGFFDSHRGQYLFYLGRFRTFLLALAPLNLRLILTPGAGEIKLAPASLRLASSMNYAPYVYFDKSDKRLLWDVGSVLKDDAAAGSKKSPYTKLLFFITAPGTTVDPNSESDLYRPVNLQKAIPAATFSVDAANSQGSAELSSLLNSDGKGLTKGLRQIVAVLETADGKSRSLTSEPVTIGE